MNEPLRLAETDANSSHGRKDPGPPPIFAAGISHIQPRTATAEQAAKRLELCFGNDKQ
jgi:hypothetical protein